MAYVEALAAVKAQMDAIHSKEVYLTVETRRREIVESQSARGGFQEFGTLTPRQHGGPMLPGQSYLVGEREPEIVHMGSVGGFAQPLGGGGSPTPVNAGPMTIENHIEIGGEVVRVTRHEINESNRSVRRRVG